MGMSSSSTGEAIALGATYGVTDKIEAGAYYSFSLHPFEIKGELTPFAAMSLMHDAKLDVSAGANLAIDLNGQTFNATTMMAESSVFFGIDAGLAVRYKITPKAMVFTGNPFQLGPAGQHLHLGLSGDESKSFSIPVGGGFQATPELFAYLQTNLATILLSDPGMGDRVGTIIDATPITLGGFYAVNKNIDAALNRSEEH